MLSWEISLGSIITVLTILVAGVGFYHKSNFTLDELKQDVYDIKVDLKLLNKVVLDLALQGQRMTILEKTIDELRHGKGYIDVMVSKLNT